VKTRACALIVLALCLYASPAFAQDASGFSYEKLLSPALQGLLASLLLPLLAPVISLVDRGRRRAEIRRKLETLKLALDLRSSIDSLPAEIKSLYSVGFEEILGSERELRKISTQTPSEPSRSSFNIIDVACSLAIPVAALFALVPGSSTSDSLGAMIFCLTAAAISVATSNYVICRIIRSGTWQAICAIVVSILSFFPSILVLAWLD